MKEFCIRAVENMRGDNLWRARRAFSRYSLEAMNQPYGQSDQTPAQIIAGYEDWERKCDAAIAWLKSVSAD